MSIEIRNVTHVYNPDNPFEKKALDDISLTIHKGEYIGIIGHTGSGKSTFLQHLNGLMPPTSGSVLVEGIDTKDKSKEKIEIRKKVGMVFQYPEYQLFEETCYKDIAFGPKNLGFSEDEIDQRVHWACDVVGLDVERMKEKSPFELSGGQKRRVAIAGVLAMKPDYLVLDEPTAGLDPVGRDEILGRIYELYTKEKITIILVTHSMEDIAESATRILVMDEGKIKMDDKPRVVFEQEDELQKMGLAVPQVTSVIHQLRKKGVLVRGDCITVKEAFEELKGYFKEAK